MCAHSVCALYSQVGVVFVGFSIAVVLGLGVDVELVFGTVVVDVGELHARAEDVIAQHGEARHLAGQSRRFERQVGGVADTSQLDATCKAMTSQVCMYCVYTVRARRLD